jgi:hypothetical protein
MTRIEEAFSEHYAQARTKFLAAARAAGLAVDSHAHPLRGSQGEALAMDVVLDGAPDSAHLLIVSSACHGVEGYCGSGVQVHALADAAWRAQAREAGVAVLYIHALNPHGFSFDRRVTHEGVDLNRNFHDFSKPLPANPDYREIADLLLPQTWPPTAENLAATERYIAERGLPRWQAAISRGQHEFEHGLFYGGRSPTWNNQTLRQVLRRYGSRAQRVAWIDLHTGLGPSGVGEKIFADRDDAQSLARARAWWGDQVTSIYDGSSSSPLLTGLMWTSIFDECPQAQYTGIALEYGTEPVAKVMQALRADHWLHLHPEAAPEQARQIRQQMREVFYTDTPAWRAQIVEQAQLAFAQAVAGLRAH